MDREVLHIETGENSSSQMLRLSGELDSYTCSRLANITENWINGSKKVFVNLDELKYIDSSGLSALVKIWIKTRDNGTQMAISCQNPRIHRILEITGLLNLFNIIENHFNEKPSNEIGLEKTVFPQTNKIVSPPTSIRRQNGLGRRRQNIL